jgi:bidirectional [NiFe] hydrogenase diaphorase subunit
MIRLNIDGMTLETEKGTTLLEVAQRAGIEIPTLCYNERLEPYGGCRLCLVEITRGSWTSIVASCVYPAEEGITVRTETKLLKQIRRLILELILPLSPTGPVIKLAEKYGLRKSRFTAEETHCVLCGLCVRYCAETKKSHAVGFFNRGTDRETGYMPDADSQLCSNCRECYGLCPGGKIVMGLDKLQLITRT